MGIVLATDRIDEQARSELKNKKALLDARVEKASGGFLKTNGSRRPI